MSSFLKSHFFRFAIRNSGHGTVGNASLMMVAGNLGPAAGSPSRKRARRSSGARDPRRSRGGRVVLAAAAVEDLGRDDGRGLFKRVG